MRADMGTGVGDEHRMFSWMTPGEVMVCEPDKLEEAKSWVAG
jgi:hypothetical protein